MAWEPYFNNRLIERHEDFAIVKPIDAPEPMPLWCPVCERLFGCVDDERAYEEFKCCDWCSMMWAYPYKEKWLEGWRPQEHEVKEKLEFRPMVSLPINFE